MDETRRKMVGDTGQCCATADAAIERFATRWERDLLPALEARLLQSLVRNIQELKGVVTVCERCGSGEATGKVLCAARLPTRQPTHAFAQHRQHG